MREKICCSNNPMEKAMRDSSSSILIPSSFFSIVVVILMLLLVLILILIACKFKPWRRFLSTSAAAAARRRSPASINVSLVFYFAFVLGFDLFDLICCCPVLECLLLRFDELPSFVLWLGFWTSFLFSVMIR